MEDEPPPLRSEVLEALHGGGGTQLFFFFSGRGVRPGFPKCGACELLFAFERGGL